MQRRSVLFPEPGPAEDDDDLARADLEVDALQHLVAAERLPEAFDAELAHGASAAGVGWCWPWTTVPAVPRT